MPIPHILFGYGKTFQFTSVTVGVVEPPPDDPPPPEDEELDEKKLSTLVLVISLPVEAS